jgi:hypothetical protein
MPSSRDELVVQAREALTSRGELLESLTGLAETVVVLRGALATLADRFPASSSAMFAADADLVRDLRDCRILTEAIEFERGELEEFVRWLDVPTADPGLVARELSRLAAAILVRDVDRLRRLREVEDDVATVRARVTEWIDSSYGAG